MSSSRSHPRAPHGYSASVAGATRAPEGTIALLFTDIEGSTRLAAELGSSWRDVLAEHHAIVGGAIEECGGFVDGTEGDAFFATFDDPKAAVSAAVTALRALRSYGWPRKVGALKVRMGLHVGFVERTETGYVGLEVHRAARVAAAAHGGQLLITGPAKALLGDRVATESLGLHRLKDFPDPEPLFCAVVDGRGAASFPPPRTQQIRPTNLPPRTRRLVGRERELAAVSDLLSEAGGQIVTIAGIGGIGKTLLAIAVGRELLDDFPGGVFLVRLARVRDERSILPMIAEAVGVTGDSSAPLSSVLAVRLGTQPTLIILDNFEQLVAGSSVLAELLGSGGELRILVTSQVPLRLGVERVVALTPLQADEGVALFLERARSVVVGYGSGQEEAPVIQSICSRLDNVPLAIELAAARVRLLSPHMLDQRLKRPLGLLTRGDRDAPARQRSLRAAIEWTYGLLDQGQQSLFVRFGVCAGPIGLAMVEALAGSSAMSDQTLDRLDELIEFSFVRRQEDPRFGIRFFVPQALRDFALERLSELGHEDEVRRLHAEHLANVAYEARLLKWGATAEQRRSLVAAASEIRPAVAWAREHDHGLYVRICAALASYWVYGGVISEAHEELRRAWETRTGTAAERAWILTLLAKCAQVRETEQEARRLADQVMLVWAAVEEPMERALGLGPASWVLRWAGRYEESAAASKEALELLRCTGNPLLTLRGLVFYAQSLADMQDLDATEKVLREADQLAAGDPVWELAAIHGDCAHLRGDNLAAVRLYAQSLSWTSTTGEAHQPLMDLRSLVTSLAELGHSETALEVFELLRLEERRTGRLGDMPASIQWLSDAVATATQQVDPERAQRAAERARQVPEPERAARAIELAGQVAATASGEAERAQRELSEPVSLITSGGVGRSAYGGEPGCAGQDDDGRPEAFNITSVPHRRGRL
jgi:predicted ATPase/class 3 adenylate cyclase